MKQPYLIGMIPSTEFYIVIRLKGRTDLTR